MKNPKLPKIEQDSWYRPIKAPLYWMELIGRVKGIARQTKKETVYWIEFHYRKDGSPLPKKEVFEFTADKLKLVTNFGSLVKRHLPKPVASEAVDYVEYEEVVEGVITPEVAAWHKDSAVKDVLYVLRSSLEGKGVILVSSSPEALKVPTLDDKVLKVAVNIPTPKKFAVGGLFDPYDVPPDWLQNAVNSGHNCLWVLNPKRNWTHYYFDQTNKHRIKVL